MTNEHLRLLIDEKRDLAVLHRPCVYFANVELLEPVLAAVRVGRLVALRKPNGRVRSSLFATCSPAWLHTPWPMCTFC